MNMTYRCKSCGSNSTASLTCDHCGAGTRQSKAQKTRPTKQPRLIDGLGVVVPAFLASTALFTVCILAIGVQS